MLGACNPDFLDVKRDKAQAVPSTLKDFDAILDNTTVFNHNSGHAMSSISAEEFEISDPAYQLLSRQQEKTAYSWVDEYYDGYDCTDWNYPYQRVLYSNIILEGVTKVEVEKEILAHYNEIKGSALFHRANAFYMLAQQFAAPLGDVQNADYGIPLVTESDPTDLNSRARVGDTYIRIVNDLKDAIGQLPLTTKNIFRPSKLAAEALLARIYLAMGQYEEALICTENVLKEYPHLHDFKSLNEGILYPFPSSGQGNPEIIFYDASGYGAALLMDKYRVNTELLHLYANGDLRKNIFFREEATGGFAYRGSYTGSGIFFTGLATDELYLIKAECLVRKGLTQEGLQVLNSLLKTRFEPDTYLDYYALNKEEAMSVIDKERRKELLNRGLRWSDLRRYNFQENSSISLSRTVDGKPYYLTGKDNRFTFLAPKNVIDNSKIIQYPR